MSPRHALVCAGMLATLTALPHGLAAQAVCSAPHSSPTLAQSGSIGTLPTGAGWIQISALQARSDEFFSPAGNRRPLLAGGEFTTRSIFLTGAVGIREGLELWAQVPTHRLSVTVSDDGSTSTGLGDIRLAARVSPELLGYYDVPFAVRAGVKIPGSDFPVDATVVPLTEGQVDYEVSVESGKGLGELPMYVMGWVGYRWRQTNDEARRKPGNERYAHLAVGGLLGDLTWELGADGLWGAAPLAQGITLTGDKRRLVQLLPTLGYGVAGGRLEVTGQISLSGRNLPSGNGLSLGYRTTWGLL